MLIISKKWYIIHFDIYFVLFMEMIMMKKIAVLTSGGDTPGMNAAVRSAVRTAISMGMTVKGVYRGYNGLIDNNFVDLDLRSVSEVINRAGTFLYTARSPRFREEEGVLEAVENCKKNDIEGVVVIGGDGSFRGARELSMKGIPCVGVPATIDNDITSTEYAIGFDTAMNTAVDMIDRLRDTIRSHDRCSAVEVMGRHAGHLALQVGIATGATAILIPEIELNIDDVISKIKQSQKIGKNHFIIVVAEGVACGVDEIAKIIEEKTGVESRATVLGHVQRGGNPTVRDRVIATRMANEAVYLLSKGIGNRVVAYKGDSIVNYDIFEALNMKKEIDVDVLRVAEEVSI